MVLFEKYFAYPLDKKVIDIMSVTLFITKTSKPLDLSWFHGFPQYLVRHFFKTDNMFVSIISHYVKISETLMFQGFAAFLTKSY